MANSVAVWLMVGVALGLRLKAFALIPAVALAVVGSTIARVFFLDQDSSVVLLVVSSATAVQLGYLGGLIARENFAPTDRRNRALKPWAHPADSKAPKLGLPEGLDPPAAR